MNNVNIKVGIGIALMLWITVWLAVSLMFFNYRQQFAYLAKSFSEGSLDISYLPEGWGDTVLFNNKHYWPLGVLPAVLLMPLKMVLPEQLFLSWGQKIMQLVFSVCIGLILYMFTRKQGWNKTEAIIWTLAFLGGSQFAVVAVAPFSWQFGQVTATLIWFVTLIIFLSKRSYWGAGIGMGLLWLTRANCIAGSVFFVIQAIKEKKSVFKIGQLAIPVILAMGIGGWYNGARFGNIWESGYNLQQVEAPLEMARSYGLFSLRHIPGNLYNFLLAPPMPVLADGQSFVLAFPYLIPNWWGMAIWYTSPYLWYLLKIKIHDQWAKDSLVAAGLIALGVFTYYGIGVNQIGYRYALDFLPLIHIVMVTQMKNWKMSERFKWLVIGSTVMNMWWFMVAHTLGK